MALKHWIGAIRLRTLPLAVASIGMGSFLAAADHAFDVKVFILAALTTIFLQILSNLSNDYGDSIHGADNKERTGPSRAVQSGKISLFAMKRAMYILGGLSFLSGIALLAYSIQSKQDFIIFLVLGIFSIIAAITYTSGKIPYGYKGLGDLMVLIFFGWVATIGSYYLHTHAFKWNLFMPATALGFLTIGVLNVNNIRDIESDKLAGKNSIPVRLGRDKAVLYHWFLLVGAIILAIIYAMQTGKGLAQYLFLIAIPLLFINARAVKYKTTAQALDPYLKQMALCTLVFVLTFGIGQLL